MTSHATKQHEDEKTSQIPKITEVGETMTVLVTGAAGLLGSQVTDLLIARGDRPRALVHPRYDAGWLAPAGADVYAADIADRAAIEPALAGVDCVIHCAARTGPWGPSSEYERVNVLGLRTMVTAAMSAGVKRFVHVSSITVHGNDVRGKADEESPLRTEPNPYSRSKVAGERLLQRMIRDDGAPVTIVRPGWIYGPGDTASFGRFAQMIDEGRMLIIGSGENHVPLAYVCDVAEGVLLAGAAEHANGRTYLLVNDEPVTQREFLNAIAAELGVPAPSRRIPYRAAVALGAAAETVGHLTRRQQPPPVMRYGLQLLGGENRFSIDRARRELGFSPAVGFAEGVRLGVAWYRAASQAKTPKTPNTPNRAEVLT
ncbi:MAG TPA: NAD-dependent epimerase/dehydratase family protein [Streptosporangiaceae bacterium]|nr:NAD-dependent epimerase/dehydratase family protein [Streptosporangiaceae bacterium]